MNAIMEPRFYSVTAYEDEIKKQQEQLKAIHKQQFTSMLKNDGSTVDALEKQYKATEKEISDLKHELGEVMGANVHGKQGNQLLDGERWGGYAPEENEKHSPNRGSMSPTGNVAKTGLNMSSGKPQFVTNNTAAHVTGLDDEPDAFFGYRPEDYKEPSDALFGKRPKDYEDEKGVINSGGGYADFFKEQREEENYKDTNNDKLTYKKHDDKLEVETKSEEKLISAEDVRQKINEISKSDYGYSIFEKASNVIAGQVTNGILDYLGSDFDIDWGKYEDYYGRPLYLEIGYTIKNKDRVFIGNQNSFCEREVLIYDNNGNEVYHDVYYTSHISD